MKTSSLAARFYRRMLRLYPSAFHEQYAEQIWRSALDSESDGRPPVTFWARLFVDLVLSIGEERMRVAGDATHSRPVLYYTAALAMGLTIVGGAAAVTVQQMLRRGADQPQKQMAERASNQLLTSAIEANRLLESVRSSRKVNLAESLEPFLIFYDKDGLPNAASGLLDSAIPVPPAGVMNYVREHGGETFTWAPQRGVRIATVIRRVDGSTSGFILAGRSLRDMESYDRLLRQMVFGGWMVVMALLLTGAFFLQRARARIIQ